MTMAALVRAQHLLARGVAGDEHRRHLDAAAGLAHALDRDDAVLAGAQAQVGDDDVDQAFMAARDLARLGDRRRAVHVVAPLPQQLADAGADRFLVVDDQHRAAGRGVGRHGVGADGEFFQALEAGAIDAQAEQRAAAELRADAERVAEQKRQPLDDRQPHAEALGAVALRVADLVELVEDLASSLARDADAGVPDLDVDGAAPLRAAARSRRRCSV